MNNEQTNLDALSPTFTLGINPDKAKALQEASDKVLLATADCANATKTQLAGMVSIDWNTNTIKHYGDILTFDSTASMNAWVLICVDTVLSKQTRDWIEKFKRQISLGLNFINLIQRPETGEIDKTLQYKPLFESLGVTKVERNGKGSKLYCLYMNNPTRDTIKTLTDNGFSNITPLLDVIDVVGLKVELPKQD